MTDSLTDSPPIFSEGLFLVPTHTWDNVGKDQPIFDVRTTKPCIGALPTVAAFRADAVRSLHPTHSVAAFGARAAEFVKGEEKATSPCPAGGVWARLYGENAKILLIGVGLNRNTYIHAVDEMLDLPERLAAPIPLTVIDYEGKKHALLYQKHGHTGSEHFDVFRKPLETWGALTYGTLGSAQVGVFDVKRGTTVLKKLWKHAEYDLCKEPQEIPLSYYLETDDDRDFSPDGASHIEALIRKGLENGTRKATVCGKHLIDRAVRIPSDFTLILNGCHLKMADGTYDNLFVNEHYGTEIGLTTAGTDRAITIEGRNGAILDGGLYNGLSEKTQGHGGLPPIWKNNLLLFSNVDGFRISGLSCRRQRWWALNFIHCANGYLGHIDFCANDTAMDGEGCIYHGLRRDKYSEVLVKNADGIDLRCGCHDIVIENITGFTEDDTVALTGLWGNIEKTHTVAGLSTDIHHITVRNIASAAFCTNVRLLNQGDIKLHDVQIDGVTDTAKDSPHMDKGLYAVRIGDTHLYGTRHATAEETYNITVRNVRGGGQYVVALAGDMKDVTVEGIEALEGTKLLLDERSKQEIKESI